MNMRRETVLCVVNERPFIEETAPMYFGTLEVLGDLHFGLGRHHFIRRIDLKQATL